MATTKMELENKLDEMEVEIAEKDETIAEQNQEINDLNEQLRSVVEELDSISHHAQLRFNLVQIYLAQQNRDGEFLAPKMIIDNVTELMTFITSRG